MARSSERLGKWDRVSNQKALAAIRADNRAAMLSKGTVCCAKFASVCPRCSKKITKGDFLVKKNGKWGCCS